MWTKAVLQKNWTEPVSRYSPVSQVAVENHETILSLLQLQPFLLSFNWQGQTKNIWDT